jgi:hypothetical protein
MRRLGITLLLSLAAAGCVDHPELRDKGPGAGYSTSTPEFPTTSTPFPPNPFPSQSETFGPRLVIPTTGGAPITGIPVGGNLYLPVTGGPPVFGIPISP